MSRYAQRRDKLRKLIRGEADAILVTNFVNVTYLTGFTGDDSYLLLARDGEVILSDPRYTEQLEEECAGLGLEIRKPGTTILDTIAKVGKKAKLAKLAIEADSMTLALHEKIAGELPKTELVPTSGLVEQLREIKDKGEVDEIRKAIEYAERAFGVVKASLRPEQTELEIAHQLENQIRLFGGTGCSFKPIVAVGPRAALPHATPTKQKVSDGDILLIDWGAFAGLYLSDLTRVLVTGRISPKLERIYGVVLNAQLAAIAKIKPGVLMSDVDAAARDLIGKAGYGKQFGHGLGHGIGQEIHESPRFAANWKRPLKAGMVVTVEPGIYFPNWGGVRIEDDVLVTKSGCEVLSSVPKVFADNVLN